MAVHARPMHMCSLVGAHLHTCFSLLSYGSYKFDCASEMTRTQPRKKGTSFVGR